MKLQKEHWLVIPFIFSIFSVSVINILSADRESSPVENRILQQAPNLENFKTKDYFSLYDKYYTDQFFGRDEMLKLYANYERKTNHSTVKNHYIINDEWILSKKIEKISDEDLQRRADILNYFSTIPKDSGKDIYYISTPCKSQALDHLYPKYSESNYVLDNLNRFKQKINKQYVNFINIDQHFNDNLSNEEKEHMYLKTDHHWNGIGALEGFKYIIKNMNILNDENEYLISDDNYTIQIDKDKEVMGSYNINTFNMLSPKDDIPYIRSKQNNKYNFYTYQSGEYIKIDESEIVATGKNNTQLTYSQAYIQDQSLYKVVNENAPIDKKVLIIKDSYQAPTSIWFADIFKTVEVFDPRIDTSIYPSQLVKDEETDIILYMFNSATFESMVDRLI